MHITFKEKCGDCDTPVLDIITGNIDEAIELGRTFQKIITNNCDAWIIKEGIRIPIKPVDKP